MLKPAPSLNRNCDYFTKAGAEALAGTIRKYWGSRGKIVRVWVDPILIQASEGDKERFYYAVKSDIRLWSVK